MGEVGQPPEWLANLADPGLGPPPGLENQDDAAAVPQEDWQLPEWLGNEAVASTHVWWQLPQLPLPPGPVRAEDRAVTIMHEPVEVWGWCVAQATPLLEHSAAGARSRHVGVHKDHKDPCSMVWYSRIIVRYSTVWCSIV